MRLVRAVSCCAALTAFAWSQPSNQCSQFNQSFGPFPYGSNGTTQYTTCAHGWANISSRSCTYAGTGWSTKCSVTSITSSSSNGQDTGITVPYLHAEATNDAQGNNSAANGGSAASDALGAVAVNSCLILPCSVSITFTGNGTGGGWSATSSGAGTSLWSDKVAKSTSCPGETTPAQPTCNPGSPVGPSAAGSSWVLDYESCSFYRQCNPCTSECSPLIVDTTGKGFQMTDPKKNCVMFNLTGAGLGCFSWPQHGSGNGWLVYDDGSGVIMSGTQLFGDFTAHAAGLYNNSPNPNGFLALGWYDLPAQGGNMNTIIDKHDKVWTKLKIWIDDHCYQRPDAPCQSLPSELQSLDKFGIHSISLVYGIEHHYIDEYGNNFRYSAVLNPDSETMPPGSSKSDLRAYSSTDRRLVYDVYLAGGAPADGSGIPAPSGAAHIPSWKKRLDGDNAAYAAAFRDKLTTKNHEH